MRSVRGIMSALYAPLSHVYALIVEALQLHIRRLRRKSVRTEVEQLRDEVRRLGSASVESLAYVSAELRDLAHRIDEHASTFPDLDMVEAPFAHRSLIALKPPARVLAVGSSESALTRSLAAFGYDVTAVASPDAPADVRQQFDAIVWRPQLQDGIQGMERIGDLLAPDGLLVLTVPVGAGDDSRMDLESVTRSLEGWEVLEQAMFEHRNGDAWSIAANGANTGPAVVLLAASLVRGDR
jgi:hypothetical protein